MAQAQAKIQPQFSQPVRQVMLMLIVLGLTGFGAFVAMPRVLPVFEANPYLNGFILFVFVIGVLACFWQVIQLIVSVRWIERFTAGPAIVPGKAPQLLASLASLLGKRDAHLQLSAISTRTILDSVATRIDEAREITRYIVNLLIFLGLLGTFYGLATTVPAVVDTISSLAPKEDEAGVEVFNRLMTGLESQLGGMGVAFASSLLGLAGSLVVGLLELFAGHGQNRFYRELENWLSSMTQVGLASGDASEVGSAFATLIKQIGEHMRVMQQMIATAAENHAALNARLERIGDTIARLAEDETTNDEDNPALERIAEGQEQLIRQLMEHAGGLDAESRMRLRSIDVQMLRILEEISAGRQESLAELRVDLANLANTLTRSALGQPPRSKQQREKET